MKKMVCLIFGFGTFCSATAQSIFNDSLIYYYQFEDDTTTIFSHRIDTTFWVADTLISKSIIRLAENAESEIYCEEVIPCNFSYSDTTAFGGQMLTTNSGLTIFWNQDGEAVEFNFGMEVGEMDTIYSDASGYFTLTRLENIFGFNNQIADTLFEYQLNHCDSEGNEQNTNLNDYLIEIGQLTGFKRFIDIYQFPEVERGIISSGVELDRGFQAYRMGDIYNYQPGDEFQIRNYASNGGPPFYNYTTTVILTRTEAPDTIHYGVINYIAENNWQATGGDPPYIQSWAFDTLNTFWDVAKLEYVVEPPHDGFLAGQYVYNEFNNIERLHLIKTMRYLDYCTEFDCYHPSKYSGYSTSVFIPNIGMVTSNYYQANYLESNNMICYSIGGEQFGECETVLGMQEQPNMPTFKVYPNPTTSDITLAFGISGNTNVTLRVLNILGEILISETRNSLSDGIHSIQLSLANLSTGMFVIEMEANGQRFAQRVVKN